MKKLLQMSAISSGVPAVAHRLPVAMETLCGTNNEQMSLFKIKYICT